MKWLARSVRPTVVTLVRIVATENVLEIVDVVAVAGAQELVNTLVKAPVLEVVILLVTDLVSMIAQVAAIGWTRHKDFLCTIKRILIQNPVLHRHCASLTTAT